MTVIEWEPFLIGSDLHGVLQNRKVVKQFFTFADDLKPKHRFDLGDTWDAAALRKGASEDDKNSPLRYDVNLGLEFLDRFRPKRKFNGNHCHRFWRKAEQDGLVSEYCRKIVGEIEERLKKIGCQLTRWNKGVYYQFGDTKLMHGFAGGVGAARKHAMHYGRSIFGHIHAKDMATFGRAEGPATSYSCPGLLKLDADYNAGHIETLRQENGWVWGYINKRSGKTLIYQHVIGDFIPGF